MRMALFVLLSIVGVMLILALRVKGCHMTEGEIFVELWYLWVPGCVCVVGAMFTSKDIKNGKS